MTNLLETAALRLEFDRAAGGLTAITNKLTSETYAVSGAGSGMVLRVTPERVERDNNPNRGIGLQVKKGVGV